MRFCRMNLWTSGKHDSWTWVIYAFVMCILTCLFDTTFGTFSKDFVWELCFVIVDTVEPSKHKIPEEMKLF